MWEYVIVEIIILVQKKKKLYLQIYINNNSSGHITNIAFFSGKENYLIWIFFFPFLRFLKCWIHVSSYYITEWSFEFLSHKQLNFICKTWFIKHHRLILFINKYFLWRRSWFCLFCICSCPPISPSFNICLWVDGQKTGKT